MTARPSPWRRCSGATAIERNPTQSPSSAATPLARSPMRAVTRPPSWTSSTGTSVGSAERATAATEASSKTVGASPDSGTQPWPRKSASGAESSRTAAIGRAPCSA